MTIFTLIMLPFLDATDEAEKSYREVRSPRCFVKAALGGVSPEGENGDLWLRV